MTGLEIALLGPPRIEISGHPMRVDTRKAVALLAYLAVEGGIQSRDTLATMFWPESDQKRARGALRRTLSTLNKALEDQRLEADRETVRLRPEHVWLDVAEFEAALKEVEDHDHVSLGSCDACIAALEGAVERYRDQFLAGFTLRDSPVFDDWQYYWTQSLRRSLAQILDLLVDANAHRAAYPIAVEYAERRLSEDPLHEAAHRRLMELYAMSGQRAKALQQYQECVRILQEELGVAPLEETTALFETLRETSWKPPAEGTVGPADRSSAETAGPPPDPSQTSRPQDLPLVGRQREWTILQERYQALAASRLAPGTDGYSQPGLAGTSGSEGYLIVVEGEAGIGKTRLVEEFLASVERAGGAVAWSRCYEGESELVFGSLIEAVRARLQTQNLEDVESAVPARVLLEGSRLLPELAPEGADSSSLPPLDNPGARSLLFDALARILVLCLAGQRPGVLMLDNLNWADKSTTEFLAYLVRRLHEYPLLVLLTWRSEDVPDDHPFRRWVSESSAEGRGLNLELERLRQPDVEKLIDILQQEGVGLPDGFAGRIFSESEGLPFFLAAYLSELPINTQILEGGNAWTLPADVQQLLKGRLMSVGETESQLLSTAAVIGRSFEFATLHRASGRDEEETVLGLEGLISQALIQEIGEPRDFTPPSYDFRHEKLRELVLQETSQARRRLLHRRVAQAMIESKSRSETGAIAGRVAMHFRAAGMEEEAAAYFLQAGDRARDLYANREALEDYLAVLALGHPDLATIHESIGDMQTLLGEYGKALGSYQAASAYADESELPRLDRKQGAVYARLGEWERAEGHFQAAAEALQESSAGDELARVYADWSLSSHQAGLDPRAHALAAEGLALAKKADDPRITPQVLNVMGILARADGDLQGSRAYFEESLQQAESLEDIGAKTAALNNLSLVLGDAGEIEAALETAQQALALCERQGDRHREAAIRNNVADLLHAAGRTDEAMPFLKSAVSIFAEIGEDSDTYQPEIWRLVEW